MEKSLVSVYVEDAQNVLVFSMRSRLRHASFYDNDARAIIESVRKNKHYSFRASSNSYVNFDESMNEQFDAELDKYANYRTVEDYIKMYNGETIQAFKALCAEASVTIQGIARESFGKGASLILENLGLSNPDSLTQDCIAELEVNPERAAEILAGFECNWPEDWTE